MTPIKKFLCASDVDLVALIEENILSAIDLIFKAYNTFELTIRLAKMKIKFFGPLCLSYHEQKKKKSYSV